jgi:hypothetical protein
MPRPASEGLRFAPNGRLLAAIAPDGTVCVRKVPSGRIVASLDSTGFGVAVAAFSADSRFFATAGLDRRVRVWETLTGALVHVYTGHASQVTCVAFAPDGRSLASGSEDTTVLVWKNGLPPPPASADWEQLWKDMAERDANEAQRAVAALIAAPDKSLPFLKERLKPVRASDAKRIQQLVADLDSERFDVRQRATAALEKFGDAAEPALIRLLADKPPLEVRQRIDALLSKLEATPVELPADELRVWRAVQALERIATAEAKRILEDLARGNESSPVSQDAEAAVKRLERPK